MRWILTNLVIVHNTNNLPGQVVVPDIPNRMVKNFTQLLQTALGLRSSVRGPLLLARAVNKRGLRGEARIVQHGLRLGDSMRIRRVGSSARRGVTAKAQGGGGWCGNSRGDSGVVVVGALNLLVFLSKSNVSIDNFGRRHWYRMKRGKTRWLVWDNQK